MKPGSWLAVTVFIVIFDAQAVAQTEPFVPQPPQAANAALTIKTTPQTIIWVDSLRYGAVPPNGELTVKNLRAGSQTVRARLKGKREVIQTVTLAANANVTIPLAFTLPANEAELHFQTAEELRDQGKHDEAIKEYRAAIKSRRQAYPAASFGLARSLMTMEEFDAAIAEARRAMKANPATSAEAYTIIANTKRTQGFYQDAVADYRTALKLAHGISPEAHTGLALADQDLVQIEEAIRHFRLAIAQANDTEPVIYFLLGSTLERERRNKEALEAYEKYLQLEPNGRQSSAVRSVLTRLRREVR